MPQIEISQRAYDALAREVERFSAETPIDEKRPPATLEELASDLLIRACNPFEADPS